MKSIKRIFMVLHRLVANKKRSIVSKMRCVRNKRKDIHRCIKLSQRDIAIKRGKVLSLYELFQDEGRLCQEKGFRHDPILDLSIIIPMYNVSQYIVGSIQSVLQQGTNYNYELLLVDDGSTDNTLEVVQPFLTDSRVVLLKQENQGQSAARNHAIKNSRGKYLMMLDGDDLLTDGSIDALMDVAVQSQSDIVEGGIARFHNSLSECRLIKRRGIKLISPQKHPNFVLTCYGYSWAKIYRRELWETLRYPEGYIFEDVISKFILRRKANQVAFIDYTVYGYRWNPASSSHNKNQIKKLDSLLVFPRIVDLCKQEGTPFDDVFYLLCLNHIGLLNYTTTRPLEEKMQRSCFSEMQKQLCSIQEFRPQKLPKMFMLLEKSILRGDFEGWKFTAETIHKYGLLKKYREIN